MTGDDNRIRTPKFRSEINSKARAITPVAAGRTAVSLRYRYRRGMTRDDLFVAVLIGASLLSMVLLGVALFLHW